MATDQTFAMRRHVLAQLTRASVSALSPERSEPRLPGLRARLNLPTRRILKALVRIGAVMPAVAILVCLRIVLTTHLVPRWQEALAHVLPFLDW